jgi:membrane associated rhomboid family serine protease
MDGPSPPPRPAPPAASWPARAAEAPASVGLLVVQVGVLAWASLAHGDPTSAPALVAAGALERGHVWSGEWWRLGSAVLLHVGWIHLGLNATFGLAWCRMVERALGTARFLLLYATAGVAASAASLLAKDVVSAGASGALFGTIGAALVLHRRALPGWRPFLRSPVTVQVVLQLAGWTAVALVGALPLDHAAHGGGLVAGALTAWVLTSPARRPAAWGALGAALLLLCAAASWPRPGLTRFGAAELERRLHAALREKDRGTAAALLAEADRAGLADDALTYYRGILAVQEGRLEEAARLLRPVALGGQGAVRAEARRALSGVARNLGYRLYTGDGAPLDPQAGLAWFEEACAVGDEASCRDVERIRGLRPP